MAASKKPRVFGKVFVEKMPDGMIVIRPVGNLERHPDTVMAGLSKYVGFWFGIELDVDDADLDGGAEGSAGPVLRGPGGGGEGAHRPPGSPEEEDRLEAAEEAEIERHPRYNGPNLILVEISFSEGIEGATTVMWNTPRFDSTDGESVITAILSLQLAIQMAKIKHLRLPHTYAGTVEEGLHRPPTPGDTVYLWRGKGARKSGPPATGGVDYTHAEDLR